MHKLFLLTVIKPKHDLFNFLEAEAVLTSLISLLTLTSKCLGKYLNIKVQKIEGSPK